MKLSWMSNSPVCGTGYGNQTKLFVPRIKRLGHDPAIIAFYGLEGGMSEWEGIPMFPKGSTPYGNDIAAVHTRSFGADVLLTLIDAWVYDPRQMQQFGVRWVPWFPVDSEPLPPAVGRAVAGAYRRIVFSKFGQRMVEEAGLDAYYVPHGVDTQIFRPLPDREMARKATNLPLDKFVVGMVAANKGFPCRKAFFENIAAFAEFHKKHPDSLLYMHTQPGGGDKQYEVNLVEYVESLGLRIGLDVAFPNPYVLSLGFPEYAMVNLYNAFDVHLLVSMGEGFGIPQLEAQACGCPVIAGAWTASEELVLSGWKVAKADSTPTWTLGASYQYTPHIPAITEALESAYRMSGNNDYRKRARDGALKYDADKVAEKYWRPVLADIEQSIALWGAPIKQEVAV